MIKYLCIKARLISFSFPSFNSAKRCTMMKGFQALEIKKKTDKEKTSENIK